jgi:hypothetical protein
MEFLEVWDSTIVRSVAQLLNSGRTLLKRKIRLTYTIDKITIGFSILRINIIKKRGNVSGWTLEGVRRGVIYYSACFD